MKAIFSLLVVAAASLSFVSCSCYSNAGNAPKKSCKKDCGSKKCCPKKDYVTPVYVTPAK